MARKVVESPFGPLTLEASAQGLTAIHFGRTGDDERGEGQTHLKQAERELEAYAKDPAHVFEVRLEPTGTEFQLAVWALVREVPPGALATYGELAKKLGKPGASRAVGAANGANPIPIIVPCHRVVGSDGSLTGYGGGLELKRKLLRHEERVLRLA